MNQLLKVWIIAAAQAEETDFVVPGLTVTLQCRLYDRFHRANPQWPLDDRRLAKAALPRAAAHDFDGDAIVRGFDERDNWACGKWDIVKILIYRASSDFSRHVTPGPVYGRD